MNFQGINSHSSDGFFFEPMGSTGLRRTCPSEAPEPAVNRGGDGGSCASVAFLVNASVGHMAGGPGRIDVGSVKPCWLMI